MSNKEITTDLAIAKVAETAFNKLPMLSFPALSVPESFKMSNVLSVSDFSTAMRAMRVFNNALVTTMKVMRGLGESLAALRRMDMARLCTCPAGHPARKQLNWDQHPRRCPWRRQEETMYRRAARAQYWKDRFKYKDVYDHTISFTGR